MATIILVRSLHGTTLKAAELLLRMLDGNDIELLDVRKGKMIDLGNYTSVIIGGSIHAGKIQRDILKYIKKNIEGLQSKKLGLFICCMEEGEKALAQFNTAFPELLRNQAKATAIFGGEFNFEKMNFFEKFIVKKITGSSKSVSKINEDAINKFALEMNKA